MNLREQDRMRQASRLRFHSDVGALSLLCSDAAVARLEGAVESLNARDRRSFLRGYRLAIATPLYGLLRFSVDHAELMGLQHDDRLSNWLHYRTPSRGESLLSAVSDPKSDLSRLCFALNDLEVALRRADDGLSQTIAAIRESRLLAIEFGEVLKGTKAVSLDAGEVLPDEDSLLRLSLAERVLDYVEYDRSIVRLAYSRVWQDEEDSRPVDDRFVLDAETHLSDVATFSFGRGVPGGWLGGMLFGFDLIIQLIGVTLPTRLHPDSESGTVREWFDKLANLVNPSRPEGKWPSQMYGLTELRSATIGRMLGHLEVNMDSVSSKHRLAALLGSDSVRLISDADGTDALELEVMVSGAVATYEDSRVQVLKLTHSVSSDYREWVSIALRLPAYGLFTNASRWYLSYKMYHEGMVVDTDVARAKKAVEELLLRFDGKLDVEKIGGLDSEDFLPFCVLPAFRAMSELSRRAVETNADLRSGNSELLAGFWLVGQGFSHVKVSFKHASLGDSDYDAVGVKDGRCLIVEVKGANLRDVELQREISEFANRIERLRNRTAELKKLLGTDVDISEVSGVFVFLGDLDRFTAADPSIPLWGFDGFVKALKEIGLPNRVVGLLDRNHIIHSMPSGAFPDDPFFTGFEASSTDD